jgi:hypothetical protein
VKTGHLELVLAVFSANYHDSSSNNSSSGSSSADANPLYWARLPGQSDMALAIAVWLGLSSAVLCFGMMLLIARLLHKSMMDYTRYNGMGMVRYSRYNHMY